MRLEGGIGDKVADFGKKGTSDPIFFQKDLVRKTFKNPDFGLSRYWYLEDYCQLNTLLSTACNSGHASVFKIPLHLPFMELNYNFCQHYGGHTLTDIVPLGIQLKSDDPRGIRGNLDPFSEINLTEML